MLDIARASSGGEAANLSWLEGDIESVPLEGPYGLIVVGAAVHWFDLPIVLARFEGLLHSEGCLVVLDGDGAVNPPWQDDEYALMLDHPQFEPHGRRVTAPAIFRQSVDDYVRAQQSRASLCRETLGPVRAAAHEERLRTLLAPHAADGHVEFQHRTRIEWGRPRRDSPASRQSIR